MIYLGSCFGLFVKMTLTDTILSLQCLTTRSNHGGQTFSLNTLCYSFSPTPTSPQPAIAPILIKVSRNTHEFLDNVFEMYDLVV